MYEVKFRTPRDHVSSLDVPDFRGCLDLLLLIFKGKLYFPKNPIPIGKVSVHDYVHDYVRQIMHINPVF